MSAVGKSYLETRVVEIRTRRIQNIVGLFLHANLLACVVYISQSVSLLALR